MLQQTQVAAVIPYYLRFIETFPTIHSLAEASEERVLKLWEGLGYYSRARNLHQAARTVVTTFDGKIPQTVEAFRSLRGVGEYIAAAVQSIAFSAPVPVVDGNVKRVISRLRREPFPVNRAGAVRVYQSIAEALLDRRSPGVFNQAMMELGALVCTPRAPRCPECPVAAFCDAQLQGEVAAFPKREKRKPVPTHRIAVGVVWRDRCVLVAKRKPEGLLGGLWEFPGGRIEPGESPEEACRREVREEVGLTVAVVRHIAEIRHAYTHFKIIMDVFECRYLSGRISLNGPVAAKWTTLEGLKQLPFPKANNKFIPLLRYPRGAGQGVV
jgi:A/G-specific adenine glycosylase